MRLALEAINAAPLTREGARAAARRELAKPPYHRDDPSLSERGLRTLGRWLAELFEQAATAGPGSRLGAVLLVLLLVLLIVAVRLRIGPLARQAASSAPLLGNRPGSPAEYRAAAAAAAESGDYATALRDQLRALAREAEVRGVLEPRAGRTADELSTEVAAALPQVASQLSVAVAGFDAVWYGGRTAVPEDYVRAVAAENALRGVPPDSVEVPGPTSSAAGGGR